MEDKRKHKRLGLTGEILIKHLGGNEGPVNATIEITDCSSDGIGFSTDAQLVVGNNYEANLTLWTKEVLHVFIQIVRAVQTETGFHYGGIFIGMPDSEKMRIEVYETVEDQLKEQNN
ncbi:PilZ domain-containing protein [Butyrivibrio sp. AE2032]|uniref:PilZ domain-containing protein n=1 Tax=Butyrivibrio sp. AE2032 TaxID=1458463 RepID=UPI00054EBA17|nr:PilZ domain-containing protein [Butyrivibrio sp. AE2032]